MPDIITEDYGLWFIDIEYKAHEEMTVGVHANNEVEAKQKALLIAADWPGVSCLTVLGVRQHKADSGEVWDVIDDD